MRGPVHESHPEALAGTVKCTVGSSYNGLIWLREVSDQGQLIKALHGAIRSTGYDAVPERRALHEYRQFSWNPEAMCSATASRAARSTLVDARTLCARL